ncbi:hypothetical protein [Methylobacter psychrophilus]|uniref:hypothetical protein n=1 Tax=Methylobacter psychrophilus TaxID=96941 RepID=UPI0021D51986|nr:hypothetical protein [Methylobacter psychrophilus]
MSASTQATQDTEQKPTFNPDFSHRLDMDYNAICTSQLCDTIDLMVMRSKAVLSIISDLHQEAHINKINTESISWALKSVMLELDDICAVVEIHHDAVNHKATVGAE